MTDDVLNFYQNHYTEDERMARETLEFARSKEIISRYLGKPRMEIADIAGASGAYSLWLAEMGHNVHLLDLVPKHIEQARQKSAESGIPLASCRCADARELPYDSESLDLVLEMGALYHLQDARDRLRCLQEAYRVLKNDGILICTVMCRYSPLIGFYKYGLEDSLSLLGDMLETGNYQKPPPSAPFYSHTPEQIVEELESAHFQDVLPIAVEGFANALRLDEIYKDEQKMATMLTFIRKTESIQELMGISRNIMAVAVKCGTA